MMEPKDWIAVAQVYATLAQAHGTMTSCPTINQHEHRDMAEKFERMAQDALAAAGLKG